jgi:dienelactone hydrolase
MGLMIRTLAALLAATSLSGAAMAAAPLEAYGRLPSLSEVAISPDGTAFALAATIQGQRMVVVKSINGPVLASAVVPFTKIRALTWADRDHVIIEVSRTDSIDGVSYTHEAFQAASLNARTGAFVQLPTKAMDSVLNTIGGRIQPAHDGAKSVLIAPLLATVVNNMQDGGSHLDLYKIDLDTGIASRIVMGDSTTYDYLAKSNGAVLAKASYKESRTRDNATWTLALRRNGAWTDVFTATDTLKFPELRGLSPDGQSVIVDTWDAAKKIWRPTPISLGDGKIGEYLGPAVDQGALVGADGVVLALSHKLGGLREYDFLEPRMKAVWPAFRNAFPNQSVSLVSWTPDLKKLVIHVEGSRTAGDYFLIDTETKHIDQIGSSYSQITPADVAMVRELRYAAADGLEIDAILTTPKGRPEKNLPLIVLPHGGPEAQDDIRFDWWAQALASRGYAVLQPNYRGSTNRDNAFTEAGYGEWGGKMQTDLSDGVAFLAREGVIDPKRVCIVGASYGGYAALAGVTLQKGIYRCAVSVAGPADLAGRFHDEILRYGEQSYLVRYRKRSYGVTGDGDPKLKTISPAAHAGNVEVPLLLIHGKDDTVVPYSESQKMAAAMRAAGKSVEFVTLSGEDHWLSKSETRLQMLQATVAFVEKNNPPD